MFSEVGNCLVVGEGGRLSITETTKIEIFSSRVYPKQFPDCVCQTEKKTVICTFGTWPMTTPHAQVV